MKLNKILLSIALIPALCSTATAQPNRGGAAKVTGVTVEYRTSFNGKDTGMPTFLTADKDCAVLYQEENIKTYIDYADSKLYTTAEFEGKDMFYSEQDFELGKDFLLVSTESEYMNGWKCQKYTITVKSNSIEVWATTDIGYSGTPIPLYGVPEGLVLKIVRNGNTVTESVNLRQVIYPLDIMPKSMGEEVTAPHFNYLVQNKDVERISVFEDEYLGFNGAKGPESFNESNLDSVYTLAGGSIIMRKVKLPEDVEGKAIFATLTQRSVKDAYDRTGSLFVIPQSDGVQSFLDALSSDETKGLSSLPAFTSADVDYNGLISTEGYSVPLELMRFFTSFGVGGYNNNEVYGQVWPDSTVFKQEVTHLAPALHGEVWIGAYIGNWTDKGHRISLDIAYHPSSRGKDPKQDGVVLPIFNTVNLLEQAGQPYPVFFGERPLTAKFYVEKDIQGAMLVYTTSGHGGWSGGDEFNPKPNTILLDGDVVMKYTPWRDDCGSYRQRNPSSGNFSNGLSSSDLSRSAWCPGTITNPIYVDLCDKNGVLRKGWHTIEVSIPQGEPEGNGQSYWCISGTIIGQ